MAPTVKEQFLGIPVIDFAPFLSGDEIQKKQVGKEMVDSMRTVGFMYIVNHGITPEQMAEAFSWSKRFFELQDTVKALCPHPKDGAHHRGWSAIGKEKVSQMVYDKEQLEKIRKTPDVKESFDLGKEGGILENFWPPEDEIPGFKEFCMNYFSISDKASKNLLRAIALGMDLEEEYFIPFHSLSDNQLRFLHYPSTKEEDLKIGKAERIGAHTDFGTLTMLLQDECGGLEVEEPYNPGSFVDAPFIKNALVVNTGDFLQRWSNDELKSTLHRVRSPKVDSPTGMSAPRYSIPFFVSADPEATIDCLPGTFGPTKPKKYDPINSLEYISMRLNATY